MWMFLHSLRAGDGIQQASDIIWALLLKVKGYHKDVEFTLEL